MRRYATAPSDGTASRTDAEMRSRIVIERAAIRSGSVGREPFAGMLWGESQGTVWGHIRAPSGAVQGAFVVCCWDVNTSAYMQVRQAILDSVSKMCEYRTHG